MHMVANNSVVDTLTVSVVDNMCGYMRLTIGKLSIECISPVVLTTMA